MGFSAYMQIIINGILTGGLYGLMACAWSFQVGALHFANFAYGSSIMLSSYWTFFMVREWGVPIPLTIVLVLAFNVALGLLLRKTVLRGKDYNKMIVCTMGVQMIIVNLVTFFFTAIPRDFAILETRIYLTKDISIGATQLVCFILSLIFLFAFQIFLKKTWAGKSIRAVVENGEVASLMGIRSERIIDLAFSLSYMLIGVAAMLLSLMNQITPKFGDPIQSSAFMVCVLAGLGNLGGTFFSGIIVGVVTALIGFIFGSHYLNPITYGLFVLVLLIKPYGLFTKASSVARKL